MKDHEVPEQGGTEQPDEPSPGASPANWADIRRDAELQRWLDDAQMRPPQHRGSFLGSFLWLGVALPYIAAMLGVLALALFLGWALKTFP